MRIGSSRKTIYFEISKDVFDKSALMLIGNTRDVIKYVTYRGVSAGDLYYVMLSNVKKSINKYDGVSLKKVYAVDKSGKKLEFTSSNSDILFSTAIAKEYKILFKVLIKNKYFEFLIEI